MDEYTVRLPDFHGPLDLLLHLVKRNEVDVRDIPIAVITEQFRASIEVLQIIDVEAVGDFLIVASILLEIKSRLVLPNAAATTGEAPLDDPRQDLVRQLLEYKRFKDAALRLGGRAAQVERRMPRDPVAVPAPADAPPAVHTPELWDLVSAFGRIMQEAAALEPEHVLSDDTPQHVYREQVLTTVRSAERVAFRAMFTPPYHRLRLIGLFLALLELIKGGEVNLAGGETASEIWLIAPVQE